jgi:hypothetical protein
LPALKILKARLRDIKVFGDSGVVDFTAAGTGLPRPWSLLLGENSAGKTTLLRCLALAASGPELASAIEPNAASYLRVGTDLGTIEVSFGIQLDPEATAAEIPRVAVGLEIRKGEMTFRPMTRLNETDFGALVRPDRLGLMRSQADRHFGLVCGYGATRGLTVDPTGVLQEQTNAVLARVNPLFSPYSWLIHPDILGKLLATGDLSNLPSVPVKALDEEVRKEVLNRLAELLPGLTGFEREDPSAVELDEVRIPLRDLSDGYGGLLALVGHLLRHALVVTGGSVDPTAVTGLVLVDEIDLHLHPAWQRHVARDLGQAFPNVQFIATSHSPMVAGGVPDEALLVLVRGENGISVSTHAESVTGWRADQILTSDLFGLATTRGVAAENLMAAYALRLHESGPSDLEVQALGRRVAGVLGVKGDGVVEAATDQLLRDLLETRFQELPEDVRQMVLARATLALSAEAGAP